jgi:hypothetical protein
MSEHKERELQYNVDRLVSNGKRVFAWGWVAHPAHAIEEVALLLEGDGWQTRLPASSGLVRDDVAGAFPRLRNAGASGFVATGFALRQPLRKVILHLRFDDRDELELDVTKATETRVAHHRKLDELRWLARAVWRRLRRGDIRGIVRRARAQNYSAPSLDDLGVVDGLLPDLRGDRAVSIVFDHNLGGGANQYRRALIDERLAGGVTVLLCTYNLPTLDYRLQVCQPGGGGPIFRISSFLGLERLLGEAPVRELFVNSPVSFDEPLVFADWISTMRAGNPGARLTFAVHDYFSVCPSFVLLDADGKYCGIPDVSECAACLKRHRARYVALSPPTEMGAWRALWGRCMRASDEVRCFSNSTRQLLLRAYPDLDPGRISVIPHRVDYLPSRLPRLDHAAPLVIGIIGHISEQKGALVIGEMLARLERDHPDVRVVVIGTLDVALKSDRLRVTGSFRHEDLVELIETSGINMFFFPSICPETFSYVTEEMMLLGLPIVAFDLGAPGERLRGYGKARLCGEVSSRAALATLVAFHEELAANEIPVA